MSLEVVDSTQTVSNRVRMCIAVDLFYELDDVVGG